MIYIPNAYRETTDPLVSTLRSSLGGIGEGLRGLANHKIQEMQEKKENAQRAAFWKSAGLPDDVAYAFGSAPVELQKALLDRLEGVSFGGQQPQKKVVQSQQPIQSEPTEFFDIPQVGQQAEPSTMQQPIAEQLQPNINDANVGSLGGIKLGVNPVERRHQENLAAEKLKNEQKSEAEKFKQSKDFRHDILQKSKAARQTLRDLDRLEELNDSKKLDTPGYVEFLKRSGLDIPALMNPESEEFQKIQQGFLSKAKDIFGGRISNYEIEQFLKGIPSLNQSPEGRKRVISAFKQIARADVEYANTVKEIMAENKGVPPYDIEEQVDDKIGKKLDKIAEQFKKDLAKAVPQGQHKLATATQATLGELAGKAPKVLGGAAAGASFGKAFGVPGAGLGALLGGLAGLRL